jgi:hypothetical protein
VRLALLAAAGALAACAYPVDRAACAIDSDCIPSGFCVAGSCGTSGNKAFNCHSTDGAATASFLDLSGDAYPRLFNRTAVNPLGDSKDLILVKPGDPEASFLVQKLRLASPLDAHLGSGMPADAPGSICASSVDAVAQWIRDGAARN